MQDMQNMNMRKLGEMLKAWKLEGATLQRRESDAGEWENIRDEWVVSSIINCIDNDWEMRIKPKMVTLPAREIPAYETAAPTKLTPYYVPCFHNTCFYTSSIWHNTACDAMLLKRNAVFLNPKDAMEAAKIMLNITE